MLRYFDFYIDVNVDKCVHEEFDAIICLEAKPSGNRKQFSLKSLRDLEAGEEVCFQNTVKWLDSYEVSAIQTPPGYSVEIEHASDISINSFH